MTAKQDYFSKMLSILNPDVMPHELEVLASAVPAHMQARIALHTKTPVHILVKLAASSCPEVRCAVGENASTPMEVLRRLAQDENPDVRYSLAENHNLSAEILTILVSDDNPYVASRAEKTVARLMPGMSARPKSAPISAQSLMAYVACA
ncbi:MAG TPA: hypothetical protein V6D22_10445 [Candidatus Obscuribacterales bacterium]